MSDNELFRIPEEALKKIKTQEEFEDFIQRLYKQGVETLLKAEIINTDQGSQYTSFAWIHFLDEQGIRMSMDSKGRAIDNIWIERFWKNIKYNYIYLNPCDNGIELLEGVREYIEYYNQKKHQAIKKNR